MDQADRTLAELESGLDEIRQSPADDGVLELIVRRPRPGDREVLQDAQLDVTHGLLGDDWKAVGSRMTEDGSAHPDMQITIMNSRAIALIASKRERWPLAGDQLYVDMDLSELNLPAGTRLEIGTALVEVTDQPHTGCRLFSSRYGKDAVKFVNSPTGKQLRLRGLNAKVLRSGHIQVKDLVKKHPTYRR
jgi:hypothetical protein